MLKVINVRILLYFISLLFAAVLIIGTTFAWLSDSETSIGNVLAAGAIDLGIDNHSYYNGVLNAGTTWRVDYDIEPVLGNNPATLDVEETDFVLEAGRQFFNFTDLKPGDWGEDTISLHVKDNDAWLCADVTLTSDDNNDTTEPEAKDGDTTPGPIGEGELADAINFFWWADDGDNVFETDETLLPAGPLGNLDVGETATVDLADSNSNIWGDQGPLPGNTVAFLAKAWCFGDATMTPYVQDGGNKGDNGPDVRKVICDGEGVNNVAQTDSLTADISFRAYQSRSNETFECDVPVTPTPTPTPPVGVSCEEADAIYAVSDSNNDQGLRKDSTAVLANRSIASAAYGAPETSGAVSDVGIIAGSFFSLGFPLDGNTASIVLGFAEPFYNGPGLDLQVYEVTGGDYADEKVKIEASKDGIIWTLLSASAARDEAVDLGILDFASFVRLTDVSDINLFEGTGDTTPDGYDVDAVKAFCTKEPEVAG